MDIRPFLPDPAGMGSDHLEIGPDRITLDLVSTAPSAACPVCGLCLPKTSSAQKNVTAWVRF